MKQDWMIHVLEDLRTFAELNGMDDLVRKLGETLDVARPAAVRVEPSLAMGRTDYGRTARAVSGAFALDYRQGGF